MKIFRVALVLATAVLPLSVNAQSSAPIRPAPILTVLDGNQVNLASGKLELPGVAIGIGTPDSGLFRKPSAPYFVDSESVTDDFRHPLTLAPQYLGEDGMGNPTIWYFLKTQFAGESLSFYIGSEGGGNQNFFGNSTVYDDGHKLSCQGTYQWSMSGNCVVTLSDGTELTFNMSMSGYLSSLTKPDGEIISANWDGYIFRSVSSSLGWMLKYGLNTSNQIKISTVNLSVDYCDPLSAAPCSVSQVYPEAELVKDGDYRHILQNGIQTISYRIPATGSITVLSPKGVSATYTCKDGTSRCHPYVYDYDADKKVTGVTRFGSTWLYDFQRKGNTPVGITPADVKNPDNTERKVGMGIWGPVWVTDELGRKKEYMYVNDRKPTHVANQETTFSGSFGLTGYQMTAGYTKYTYGPRANVTEERQVSKAGSNLPDIVRTTQYSTECSNYKICNNPEYTIDAKGNRWDFDYYPEHGGIKTETGPAAANNVRPQARYYYTQLHPQVKNALGVLANSTPVWRLTRRERCASSTNSCAGTADETVVLYEYNHNNLLKTAEITMAGNAVLSQASSETNVWQKTVFTYDAVGNVVMVDGPRTDVDDRSYTTYDVLRRKIYEIGVDPDGSGSLLRQVIKHQYDADGNEERTYFGTASGVIFSGDIPVEVSGFNITNFKRMTYDSHGRLTRTEVVVP